MIIQFAEYKPCLNVNFKCFVTMTKLYFLQTVFNLKVFLNSSSLIHSDIILEHKFEYRSKWFLHVTFENFQKKKKLLCYFICVVLVKKKQTNQIIIKNEIC